MPSQKVLDRWGVLGKIETTYGEDAKPIATADGVLPESRPSVSFEFLTDGARGRAPGSGAEMPSSGRSGRKGSFTLEATGIGPGQAYSATSRPIVDTLLRVAGLKSELQTAQAQFTATVGASATVGATLLTVTGANVAGKTFFQGQTLTIAGTEYRIGFTVSATGSGASATATLTITPGLAAAVTTSTSVTFASRVNSVIYSPTLDDVESGTFVVYDRGQEFRILGSFADAFGFTFDGPTAPTFNGTIVGLGSTVRDRFVPNINLPPTSRIPPTAKHVRLNIGDTSEVLVLRSGSFEMNRELSDRVDSNNRTGYRGLAPGGRAPTISLVVESTTLPMREVSADGSASANDTTFDIDGIPASLTMIDAGSQITIDGQEFVYVVVEDANVSGGSATLKLDRGLIADVDDDTDVDLYAETTTDEGINPYTLLETGELLELEFDVGTTQYNRWKFRAPNAQLTNLSEDEDGVSAVWNLTFSLAPSTYATTDDFSIVFD